MASAGDGSKLRAVSLEQLVALNDEIRAIVDAGMPMEGGLRALAQDSRDELGGISDALSQRMERGESLEQAIEAEGHSLPDVYSVVVKAGLRAGRLPAALEGLSDFAMELLSLRRKISVAMVYPLILVFVAYALFLMFVTRLISEFVSVYEMFRIPISPVLGFLSALSDLAWAWWWLPPACFLVYCLWRYVSRDAGLLSLGGTRQPLTWMPGVNGMLKNYTYASFARLLALMTQHGVVLPEGIVLAAQATGDARFRNAAGSLASAIRDGKEADTLCIPSGFPPVLFWMMSRGQRLGRLPQALAAASETYRKRAVAQADWFKVLFPLVVGGGVGGLVTVVYVLSVFLPFTGLLKALALE